MRRSEHQVVIAGAGPTGLVLAIELARRGSLQRIGGQRASLNEVREGVGHRRVGGRHGLGISG